MFPPLPFDQRGEEEKKKGKSLYIFFVLWLKAAEAVASSRAQTNTNTQISIQKRVITKHECFYCLPTRHVFPLLFWVPIAFAMKANAEIVSLAGKQKEEEASEKPIE